jgi:hypothetical protein
MSRFGIFNILDRGVEGRHATVLRSVTLPYFAGLRYHFAGSGFREPERSGRNPVANVELAQRVRPRLGVVTRT